MPNTRLTRTLSLAAVSGLVAASMVACAPAEGAGDTITVGTLRAQPHLYTPYFYDQFAPEGKSFEIVLFDSSSDIKNAVVSGSVDLGVTGAPSVLAGLADGQDVKIIASSADGGSRIVGAPDITDPQDLAGKTIGYPMGASQEILLKLTLEDLGIDPDNDVTLVNLPFSEMANAYTSGQIDAMSSAEIGPSVAMDAGAVDIVSPYDTPVGEVNIVLAATGEFVAEEPDLAQEVVDTHIQASEYMAENPEEWSAGLVEDFGMDAAVADLAIQNVTPRWELDDDYQAQVAALAEQMLAFGQVSEGVDTSAALDPTFVDASTVND
ncbi:ABC transporter substrate-binding protein [Citricoccus sp.]|uniref:ABC transporter substrate-binding protein n=1 Tax=Citricoccus sp. TaxID=1978372 RepID=UPI0028BED355|nr:ABC transporter substrate-binding protein [Citricoccus sp.]